MNARKNEAATPKARAEPPSAVKNVEESRQQRLQRAQARFRDRGGIFVPTNRTTLADILLGKKEASPKKSRRSRSRSVSPQKQPASPTKGRGKRVSLSSSAAIAAGEISVSQPELRRSPRKSTTASHKSSTSRKKTDTKKDKSRQKGPEVGTSAAASTTLPSKRKADAEDDLFSRKERAGKPERKAKAPTSRSTKGKAKAPPKGGRKGEELPEPEASTSRLPPQAPDSDADEPIQPSKGRAKTASSKTRNKSSKKAAPSKDDDDDVPLAALKTRSKPAKRKLSIVEEENEEDDGERPAVKPAKVVRQPSPSPSPPPPPPPREPSRKKQKVVPEPVPPPPVKKPSQKKATTQRTKAKATTAAKKSHIVSDDESDIEPPLPKSMQKKTARFDDNDDIQPSKNTAKGKGKALVESDAEGDEPVAPKKSTQGKGKATTQADIQDDEPVAPKKSAAQKTSKKSATRDIEPSQPKGKKGKEKPEEEDTQTHPEGRGSRSKGKGNGKSREEPDVEIEQEEEVPKKSKSKAKKTAPPPPLDDDDAQLPAKSSRKRPATPDAEEELTPTKRMRTLPLQEVDEQSPPASRKAVKEMKAPGKYKPAFKTGPLKMKENSPASDFSDGSPAKRTRSRTKPSSKITGPRKSVMVRMKQPLPPIEDNDPDPIDFLS